MAFKDKSPAIQEILNDVAFSMYDRTVSDSLTEGICVRCGKSKGEFSDTVCETEYNISGMCEQCQAVMFGA